MKLSSKLVQNILELFIACPSLFLMKTYIMLHIEILYEEKISGVCQLSKNGTVD